MGGWKSKERVKDWRDGIRGGGSEAGGGRGRRKERVKLRGWGSGRGRRGRDGGGRREAILKWGKRKEGVEEGGRLRGNG